MGQETLVVNVSVEYSVFPNKEGLMHVSVRVGWEGRSILAYTYGPLLLNKAIIRSASCPAAL